MEIFSIPVIAASEPLSIRHPAVIAASEPQSLMMHVQIPKMTDENCIMDSFGI